MEIEKVIKIAFFTGYNYYLIYFNIERKHEDLKISTGKLQSIINKNHKPFIFKGEEIVKNCKKILTMPKIQVSMKTKELKRPSISKKIPPFPI